jgi:hypothetical protein
MLSHSSSDSDAHATAIFSAHSMCLYSFLVEADLVVWTMFANGAFK